LGWGGCFVGVFWVVWGGGGGGGGGRAAAAHRERVGEKCMKGFDGGS
jgi:hypothetical protein